MRILFAATAVVLVAVSALPVSAAEKDCTLEKPKGQVKCLQDKINELQRKSIMNDQNVDLRNVQKGECVSWMTEGGEIKSRPCGQTNLDVWQIRRK